MITVCLHYVTLSYLSANHPPPSCVSKQAALEAGADAFVTKPFSYESFMEAMHNAQAFLIC